MGFWREVFWKAIFKKSVGLKNRYGFDYAVALSTVTHIFYHWEISGGLAKHFLFLETNPAMEIYSILVMLRLFLEIIMLLLFTADSQAQLSPVSPVFTISIPNMKLTTLQLVVEYLYSSQLLITEENVEDLMKVAHLLQLDELHRAVNTHHLKLLKLNME